MKTAAVIKKPKKCGQKLPPPIFGGVKTCFIEDQRPAPTVAKLTSLAFANLHSS